MSFLSFVFSNAWPLVHVLGDFGSANDLRVIIRTIFSTGFAKNISEAVDTF